MGHGRHLSSFIRDTNPLERSLAEVKRRTKVMGRFPGEDSCLSLVWAVLDLLITHETNGIRFNQLDGHASSEPDTRMPTKPPPRR
jgi:transposase-like protein